MWFNRVETGGQTRQIVVGLLSPLTHDHVSRPLMVMMKVISTGHFNSRITQCHDVGRETPLDHVWAVLVLLTSLLAFYSMI